MKTVKLLDKEFDLFLSHDEIQTAIQRMASEISKDLVGEDVLFVCILNGSFLVTADLMKEVDLEQPEVTFLRLASYEGTDTTGKVKQLLGLNESIEGRTIVVIEDIVDTGITIAQVKKTILEKNPKNFKIATLLLKPGKFDNSTKIDYVGIEIPDDFIVGYGLDYDGKGRNLRDIYKIKE